MKVTLPKNNVIVLIGVLVLVLALPFFMRAVRSVQDIRQHAATSASLLFVDSMGGTITQTTSSTVSVKLTSSWPVPPQADSGGKSLFSYFLPQVFAQTAVQAVTSQIKSATDDVNEDGSTYTDTTQTVFVGTGQSTTQSYAGLRFTNLNIPKGATISSAQLQVYAAQAAWLSVKFTAQAHAIGNSQTFSSADKPSQRSLTTASVNVSSNSRWNANTWYTIADVGKIVQEIVSRGDWQSGNSLALILKGGNQQWGRKYAVSFDGTPANAPRLTVTYTTGSATPTPLPTTPPTPTSVAATSTPMPPTATPTPIPFTTSVVLAEDAGFTQHVVTLAFPQNPLTASYTFSNPATGTKTLYAKFINNLGQEQVVSSTISLVSTATATPVPSVTGTQSGAGGNSMAMGLWNPNPKFDTCPSYPQSADTNNDGTIDQNEKNAYIKAVHDSYKVKGPDGKWYPTWHPPVDPTTGCKFGHEHGQDPSKSNIWVEVKDHYAYVNPDGTKDLVHAGIPFAYVNEQMDAWVSANNNGIPMRHEDHVGHKVAIANNFQIGLNSTVGGTQFFYPGVTCNYIVKVHQGTHSKDAFENNLHEILYNVHCSDGHRVNLDTMGKFGKPGEFTRSCDSAGDRTSIIKTGFDYSNANYPGSDESVGTRGISDRSCIETGFLVPQGQFSQNPYEFWPVVTSMTKKDGTPIVDGLNLLFDVEDSVRYYYPGHVDPATGLVDNLGRMQDLCYENLNGRTFRGSICDGSTNYGAIKGITWDDPRAGFKDLNRGTYFKPGVTHNAGGANVWYTDPFGNNAQATAFPGSLQQYVSSDSINYAQKANANETANVINMVHDSGGGTVHAPN